MIYLPRGSNWAGKTIEPIDLMEEIYGALHIAQRTSQFQWKQPAFADLSSILAGENTIIAQRSVDGHFFTTSGQLPNFGAANLWLLPYNASPAEVGDGDVAHTWVSSYPELVLAIFTFQYCRDTANTGGPDAAFSPQYYVRSRLQMAIDGGLIPGAGVYTIPIDATPRGLGLACRTLRNTIIGLTFLPAGAHRFSPVASQYTATPAGATNDAFRAPAEKVFDATPPNVKIGNRKTILVRAPQGRELRA